MQKKLMKLNEYTDGTSWWRVACDCGDSRHDVALWFEADRDINAVTLSIETELYAHAPWHDKFWRRWVWRIRTAARALFIGEVTAYSNVILDKEGVAAMRIAMEEGFAAAQKAVDEKNAKTG